MINAKCVSKSAFRHDPLITVGFNLRSCTLRSCRTHRSSIPLGMHRSIENRHDHLLTADFSLRSLVRPLVLQVLYVLDIKIYNHNLTIYPRIITSKKPVQLRGFCIFFYYIFAADLKISCATL